MKATYTHFGVAGSIEGLPSRCVPALEEMYREGDFLACNLVANKQEIGELAVLDQSHEVLGGFAICLDETAKPTFNATRGIASITTYRPVTEDEEMISNQHRGFHMDEEEAAAHRFGGRELGLDVPDVFAQIEDTPPLFESEGLTANGLDIMPINWAAPVEDEHVQNADPTVNELDITEIEW